ncbi:MAG: glycerol kinase GlpK [Lachnospiraceae bacterium]|nr:glycerol kinase GlpK [Lachnospiraceae bacterium]
MEQLLMALDQGTTSSRCILFNRQGEIVSVAQKEFTQYYPQAGWVEHDPMEIWSTQMGVAREAMEQIGAGYEDIAALGITNQRETTILWDRNTGDPIYPAIVWQCRRTADICEKLEIQGYRDLIFRKTGLKIDAYFSATKIQWILNHVDGARAMAKNGEILFGTVDTWLIWKLTKGAVHATDYTNAARTMLYNIVDRCWDEEILELLDIPKEILPEVHDSSYIYGETDASIFGGPIPIAGVAGDQQASLFGQTCFSRGDVKNTYGTGGFLLMNVGDQPVFSDQGLLTTIAWGIDGKLTYALEGSVFVAGAAVQWLRDEMGLIRTAAESEEIAMSVPDTNGVYMVPAFVGLGAPYWDPYARGIITGLTRGANRNHIVRAVLEALAFQTYDVVDLMEREAGLDLLPSLRVDGGASANQFLMQFQADVLQTKILRPKCIETTALGAAYLAGLAVGYYQSREEIAGNWKIEHIFEPSISPRSRDEKIEGWRQAVAQAMKE